MTMTSSAESNLDYCRRREDEEREAAASTKCPQAQDVHFQMAERYADLAWSIEESTDAAYRPSSLWQAIAAKLDVLSPANDVEPFDQHPVLRDDDSGQYGRAIGRSFQTAQ